MPGTLIKAGQHRIVAIMAGLNGEKPLQIIEEAGRTAYQSRDKISDESASKFVDMLRRLGHESVLEHSCMTVEFNKISRGFTHDLVRHRLAAYTQESTRYVDEKDLFVIMPPHRDILEKNIEIELPSGHKEKISPSDFVSLNHQVYRGVRAAGWVPEDGRQLLPNGMESQIVVTANLREWRHIFKLRCSIKAHWEMRYMMVNLLRDVQTRIPIIFDDFVIAPDGMSAEMPVANK